MIKWDPKARLTPLQKAQKLSNEKYDKIGTKSKANPFAKSPKIIKLET